MGAYGPNHIDFTKGEPSMYAVDLAIPVEDDTILEGMCISENPATGKWVKGCAFGRLPYVTKPGQFPNAPDVKRVGGQIGAGNMGGIALTNSLEFATTAFSGSVAGKFVFGDTDGNFKPFTNAATQTACGFCRKVMTDPDGDSVAIIVSCVNPVVTP